MTIESCRETDEGSFDGFRLYVNDRSVSRVGHFSYRIPSAALCPEMVVKCFFQVASDASRGDPRRFRAFR